MSRSSARSRCGRAAVRASVSSGSSTAASSPPLSRRRQLMASAPAAGPWPAPAADTRPAPAQDARRPPRVPTYPSVRRRACQRNTRPAPAPAAAHKASAAAACTAAGPVGRSWAYGGREKPVAVSQPMPLTNTAATGSAAMQTVKAIAAQAVRTPVAGRRPGRAAAAVPTARNMAKAAGSAYGAGIAWYPSPFFISRAIPPAETGQDNVPNGSLTRGSQSLTGPIRRSRRPAPSVGNVISTCDNQLGPGQPNELPETFWYSAKRRLLGPPMINAELREQRLSRKLALGVLSPDGISSSAYGTEEILIELMPLFGLSAFFVIVPMTGLILFVMLLVVLSSREIVTVYTRAGGSYVVARENFGPRIAQVAAVALLIDYVVTVAVQIAAGTAAVASAVPAIGPYVTEISIGVILLMCYGNLRGIKEAGKIFALPTYLFSAVVIAMIVIGLGREVLGDLPQQNVHHLTGLYGVGHGISGVGMLVVVYALLKSFANGGSSLTGIEAVSNAVSALEAPEGVNARKVLVTEGLILGALVAGISWLAHLTHAAPYKVGYPTVIAQEADLVFGHAGHFMFFVVQAATALILYTGGNTSFNGFPFLTSFVAEDSFLPRWLMKRGQRLVFSNGIIVLTVLSVTLIGVVGSNVNALVPFYAIGVFTAFSMAGFGMARYHTRHKEP